MFEERIPVMIFGQKYEILGTTSDQLYYSSLARHVEEKMKEIQQVTNIVSSQKIAVLAALNIADELFREREQKSQTHQVSTEKTEELLQVLDRALGKILQESPEKNSPEQCLEEPALSAAESLVTHLTPPETIAASAEKLELSAPLTAQPPPVVSPPQKPPQKAKSRRKVISEDAFVGELF